MNLQGYKTITANLLFTIIPIMELTEFRDVLPNDWLPMYSLAVVLANMYLRYLTTTPIGQRE